RTAWLIGPGRGQAFAGDATAPRACRPAAGAGRLQCPAGKRHGGAGPGVGRHHPASARKRRAGRHWAGVRPPRPRRFPRRAAGRDQPRTADRRAGAGLPGGRGPRPQPLCPGLGRGASRRPGFGRPRRVDPQWPPPLPAPAGGRPRLLVGLRGRGGCRHDAAAGARAAGTRAGSAARPPRRHGGPADAPGERPRRTAAARPGQRRGALRAHGPPGAVTGGDATASGKPQLGHPPMVAPDRRAVLSACTTPSLAERVRPPTSLPEQPMSFISNAVDTLAETIGRAVGVAYGGPLGGLVGQAIGDVVGVVLGNYADRLAHALFGGMADVADDIAANVAQLFASNYSAGFEV